MQPYFFPYIGYFQLIHAVDVFVVYDDVQFIKGGWINRNRILVQGRPHFITLDLEGASPNRLISEVRIRGRLLPKILKTIAQSYAKAPESASAMALIKEALMQKERNLASYLDRQLKMTCEYLGVHVDWVLSSSLPKDPSLRGQEKLLDICERLGATHYINLPGGRRLYDPREFRRRNIRLSFLYPASIRYRQFENEFVPNLSIVDVVMFNNKEECSFLLDQYGLDDA